MTRLALAILLVLSVPASAADITGTAKVTDGDTLRVGGQRVRICGIQAPERDTRAGQRATAAMASLVAGQRVRCVPVGSGTPCDGRSPRTSYDRLVAQCFVGRRDLAAEMVRRGHAEDWRRHSGGFYAR